MADKKIYFTIEAEFNIEGKILNHYWTGAIPHLSDLQAEKDVEMWSTDISKARKIDTEAEALLENKKFKIFGKVKPHS